MEEQNKQPRSRKGLIITAVLVSFLLIIYTVLLAMSPARKMDAIRNESGKKETGKNIPDERFYSDSLYLRLLKEKSFLQSRINMAESDSIYLTLNVPDSTLDIEICGVSVHKAKLSSLRMSNMLKNGNDAAVLSMLASPFTVANSVSTIKKEPLMIKMAPKDTSEFKPDVMPDTSLTEPVYFILEMTNGTRVFFYEQEDEAENGKMDMLLFDIRYRAKDVLASMKDAVKLKVPEYHPYIKMRLSRSDAKIIYRAIPRYCQMGVYL